VHERSFVVGDLVLWRATPSKKGHAISTQGRTLPRLMGDPGRAPIRSAPRRGMCMTTPGTSNNYVDSIHSSFLLVFHLSYL
jgi:hypothetical protein